MRCQILHESKGRIRIRDVRFRMTMEEADKLQYYLQGVGGVRRVTVNDRTRDAVIEYTGPRESVLDALARFDYDTTAVAVPEHTGRALQREFEDQLFFLIAKRLLKRLLLPADLRHLITLLKSIPYIVKAVRCIRKGRIEVSVLDAVSIVVAMLAGDFETASSVMFMLKIGELLEDWTHKRSVDDLAERMSLNVDKVWVRCGGTEVLTPVNEVAPGDVIVVRAGGLIPLDGTVLEGEASVNQASMTGEHLPVRKTDGSAVYAGTVVDEGECVITVTQASGSGRYDRIIRMIEDSEKLKSETEARASHLADKLVPFSLVGAGLAWALTGNIAKALAILMVDYSCALKLAMPVSVLSAMREGSDHRISIKGGKFLEAAAEAETIVFDKTGTLTCAAPRVTEVVPFGGRDADEMLRLAACLEEHFPHTIANAVVEAAREKDLRHDEIHSRVEYVVAHGIASAVGEERVLIGSSHFIFEDEGVTVPEGGEPLLDSLPPEQSHLYLAVGGELAAVLCIEDKVKEEAAGIVAGLHELGFSRVVMLTGDSRRTAAAVAARLGIDEFRAEVLPEDKAAFIRAEHEAGRKVIMVGDGINDAPALSEADAGIAISAGAAIAREVADITITEDDLHELLTLRRLSAALMRRIGFNYRFIMGVNSLLILLGLAGLLPAAATALLHNASTLFIGLRSMKPLLSDAE
ncbi:MAG: heavy metal translocating P-type ATPase [Lachnospiraceae bacterium]|nr:heavy metal translocating P-type ATPase [Lachnospiraceae bacterium]